MEKFRKIASVKEIKAGMEVYVDGGNDCNPEEMAKAFIVDGKVLKNNLMKNMSSFEVEFTEDKESWLINCKKGQVRKVAYWNLAVRA